MGKSRDEKVHILSSTTRKGTTLSTSAALDSPSVMSQLITPPQASRVGTSAESEITSENFDDASTVLDESIPLGVSAFSICLDLAIVASRKGPNEPLSLRTVEASSKLSEEFSNSAEVPTREACGGETS